MTLRRGLGLGSLLCIVIGATALALSALCLLERITGTCELWLLVPLVSWPLGAGLALIARAMRQSTVAEPGSAVEAEDSDREQT